VPSRNNEVVILKSLQTSEWVVIVDERGAGTVFLATTGRSCSIVIDPKLGLEPCFLMNQEEALELAAWKRSHRPICEAEVVEYRTLDPVQLSRRYDQSLRRPYFSNRSNHDRDYGKKLFDRMEAEQAFLKRKPRVTRRLRTRQQSIGQASDSEGWLKEQKLE
jgi:hypothetical protein